MVWYKSFKGEPKLGTNLDDVVVQRLSVQLSIAADEARVRIDLEELSIFGVGLVADHLELDVAVFAAVGVGREHFGHVERRKRAFGHRHLEKFSELF